MPDPLDDAIDRALAGDGEQNGAVRGVFREINGRLMLIDPTTGAVIKDYGPVQQQAAQPTSHTTVSLRDPRALALEREQLDEQIRQFDAELALAQQEADFERQSFLLDQRNRLARLREELAAAEQLAIQEQQFTAGENAADRALRASEFGAGFGLDTARLGLDRESELFRQQRGIRQDAAAAAEQFARLIGLTDPAAVPAFLEAGGGNIANALATGADALSTGALLPAARTLRVAEQPARTTVSFDPVAPFDPFMFSPEQFGAAAPAPAPAPTPTAPQQPLSPLSQAFATAPPPQTLEEAQAFSAETGTARAPTNRTLSQEEIASLFSAALGENAAKFGFADGGSTDGVIIRVGERGNPETIVNPTNAPLFVIPDGKAPAGAQKAQEGGVFGEVAEEEDIPFLDRVRAMRQGVDVSEPLGIGPFNVQFANLLPSLQQRFLQARQTRFGVPVADQVAEISRFMIPGVSRGALSFGR